MGAQILSPTAANIELAARELLRGELVAIPTETVYGLAGLAFDPAALAKIFATKERPTFDPLICHISTPADQPDWLARLEQCGLVDVGQLKASARHEVQLLLAAFWPGPLTLVLPKQAHVPDLATSGLRTVAVRSPAHPIAQALLQAVGQPLAAPSANRFGRISPTRSNHVLMELGDRINWILEGGDCQIGVESTILFVHPQGGLTLLRPGGIALEAIASRTGLKVTTVPLEAATSDTPAVAPGLLASHYAPRKSLTLMPTLLAKLPKPDRDILFASLPKEAQLGVLFASGNSQELTRRWEADLQTMCPGGRLTALSLSEQGESTEAARNLFAALRALDEDEKIEILWAEPFPSESGLGFAINDRLRRASHR